MRAPEMMLVMDLVGPGWWLPALVAVSVLLAAVVAWRLLASRQR